VLPVEMPDASFGLRSPAAFATLATINDPQADRCRGPGRINPGDPGIYSAVFHACNVLPDFLIDNSSTVCYTIKEKNHTHGRTPEKVPFYGVSGG
jgi:hypothetical protein